MHKSEIALLQLLLASLNAVTALWYPHHVEIQAGQHESTCLGAQFHVFKAMGTRREFYLLDRLKVCDLNHFFFVPQCPLEDRMVKRVVTAKLSMFMPF